jgi:hypothetical protein
MKPHTTNKNEVRGVFAEWSLLCWLSGRGSFVGEIQIEATGDDCRCVGLNVNYAPHAQRP